MKRNTITLRTDDFKYPSLEERRIASENFPNFSNFGFEHKHEIISILEKNKTLSETNKAINLFWWDNCLQNKLARLNNAYINTITNFNRGIPETTSEFEKENHLNKIQFDFYVETLYYFLFSTKDIILQILNIYYNIGLKEYELSFFKKIKKGISDSKLVTLLEKFNSGLKPASDIRNRFTHRFPINQPDYRTNLSDNNGNEMLSFGSGNTTTPKEIISNIDESLIVLADFLEQLKKEMNLIE